MTQSTGPPGPSFPPFCTKCFKRDSLKEVNGRLYCTIQTGHKPSCYQKQVTEYDVEICIFCSKQTTDNYDFNRNNLFYYCFDCFRRSRNFEVERCYMCSEGEDTEKVCARCKSFVRCYS